MAGYWLADLFDLFAVDEFAWLALVCAVLSSVFNRFLPWFICFLAASISAGSCYYLLTTSSLNPDETLQAMPVRELELSLEVTKSFDRKDSFGRLSGIAEIVRAPEVRSDLPGKRVHFQLTPPNESTTISQGSILTTVGLLVPRPNSLANDFERYLDHSGVSYLFNRGSIHEITEDTNEFSLFCRSSNKKLESILRLGEDGDHASTNVAVAMMLGKKAVLQPERKKRYVRAGVMHLFAISGLHVGVVGASLAFIFRWLPIPKWT
ncbi:MAG: ComEC/Rec2 family competence protein, partial [Opitutales bacterium]